jgi:hypothetical protein
VSVLLKKNRHVDQWNGMEDPEINQSIYSHLILDKDAKSIHWKTTLNVVRKTGYPTCRRMKLEPYLSPFTEN